MLKKHKIINKIDFSGVGVHSGKKVKVSIQPLNNQKIIFYNKKQNCSLEPDISKVINKNSTILASKNCKIRTIEHILAILYVFQIKGIKIELSEDEFPILDGSAKPLIERFKTSITNLKIPAPTFKIKKKIFIKDNDSYIRVSPHNEFKIKYTIDYGHPSIGKMTFCSKINKEIFIKQIAGARTFGFFNDIEYLRKKGLAHGASFNNTVVLNKHKVMNPPLRYKDEFVKHKVMDFLGDLSFIKYPVKGFFDIHKGGHLLHCRFVKKLINNLTSDDLIT